MKRIIGLALLCCLTVVFLFVLAGNPRAEVKKGIPLSEVDRLCTFHVHSGEVVMQPIKRFPVMMHLSSDLPRAISDIAVEAMERWNRGWVAYLTDNYEGDPFGTGKVDSGVVSLQLFDWRSSKRKLQAAKDGVNAIVLSESPWEGEKAETAIRWSSTPWIFSSPAKYDTRTPITDADIKIYLNKRPRVNYREQPPRKGETDALTVLAHELGHVLGLGHSHTKKNTLMAALINRGKRFLPSHEEFDNLMCVYGFALHYHYSDGSPVHRVQRRRGIWP